MQENVKDENRACAAMHLKFPTIDAAACGLQLLDSLLHPMVQFTTRASSMPHCSIYIAISN
jgi:hypothetical protein